MDYDPLRGLVEFLKDHGIEAEWQVNWVHVVVFTDRGYHFVNISIVNGGLRIGGWGTESDIPLDLPNSLDLLLERLYFYNNHDSTKIDGAPSG